MDRSFTSRANAQAVLDLYAYSDRLQIVAALNEDRRRRRTVETLRALARRLHRSRPERTAATTCATC